MPKLTRMVTYGNTTLPSLDASGVLVIPVGTFFTANELREDGLVITGMRAKASQGVSSYAAPTGGFGEMFFAGPSALAAGFGAGIMGASTGIGVTWGTVAFPTGRYPYDDGCTLYFRYIGTPAAPLNAWRGRVDWALECYTFNKSNPEDTAMMPVSRVIQTAVVLAQNSPIP